MKKKPNLTPPPEIKPLPQSGEVRSNFSTLIFAGAIVLALGLLFIGMIDFNDGQTTEADRIAVLKEDSQFANDVQGASNKKLLDEAQNETQKREAQVKEKQKEKQKAQDQLTQLLRLQARLENDGIKIWGVNQPELIEDDYPSLLNAIQAADTIFRDEKYVEAIDEYAKLVKKLKKLEAAKAAIYEKSIEDGNSALQNGIVEESQRAFEVALSADPLSEQAQKGLQFSNNLPEVLSLMEQGERKQTAGEFKEAKVFYEKALTLFDEYDDARRKLDQVNKIIADNKYTQSLTATLSLIEKKEYNLAKKEFDIARKIKPNAPELVEINKRLVNLGNTIGLEERRAQAARFEEAEKWEAALSIYQDVLSKDRSVLYAIEGEKKAKLLIDLHKKLQVFIDNPSRLVSSKNRDIAVDVVGLSEEYLASGQMLKSKVDKVSALVAGYSQPVKVVINSDNKTDITISKIGAIGKLNQKEITLYPGNYRVLGTRSGYRDQRIRVDVLVGSDSFAVTIRCEEKI